MANNKHLDTMHSYNNNSNNNNNNNNTKKSNSANSNADANTMTRMHPSMKRPRAPIACYRCHHKKVRCDGEHPNCTRCLSTGVLCAYPSSRRSRNTQPTNVDPFIDNLSQLEARIRRIETDLESQRALVRTVCANDNPLMDAASVSQRNELKNSNNNTLASRMLKTEKDLQESRSIVAQLRLRGEQRAARGRRAAAAAAAASVASSTPGPDKNVTTNASGSGKLQKSNEAVNGTGGKQRANHSKLKSNSIKKEKPYIHTSVNTTSVNSTAMNNMHYSTAIPSPPFYFTSTSTTSPTDFINPSPTYYFPSYTTDLSTPICSTNSSTSSTHPHQQQQQQQQQQFNFQDWPLLNDLPHTSAPSTNDFVDPMIIAAAEAHQNGIAPPLLSVSSYMIDEENSIMAARARSLSHLPPNSTDANMLIPGLQPSSSSTSTSSNSSFGYTNQPLYENYSQFMDNNDMMMIDGGAQTASLR